MRNPPCPKCEGYDLIGDCETCHGYNMVPFTDKADLFEVYQSALERIVKEHGQVCLDFETCTHKACNASYGAWMVADLALKGFTTDV